MYLKKITIVGFKSFAKKTVIDFEPGITCIVGPNGSGKSNVSDAIKWVLGEQSKKNLRSKKSGDVIFAGSGTKSKSGMAEVTLELDNSQKIVPIDYTDVAITRRVYRSGESEYFLNGSKARLMDISEILSKSGFGRSTYTVIGQGMVDKLITQTKEERRELFQDASGVKHFYLKRDQVLRKFKETRDNLTRVSDVLRELKPRLSGLERQQKEAEERKTLTEKLRDFQKKYYGSEINDINNKLSDFESKFQENSNELTSLKQEVSQITDILEKREKNNQKELERKKELELYEIEEQLQKLQDSLFDLIKKDALTLEKAKFYKENLSLLEEQEKEIAKNINEKTNEINVLKKEKEDLKSEIDKLSGLKDELGQEKEELLDPKEIIKKIKKSLSNLVLKIQSSSGKNIKEIEKEIKDLIIYLSQQENNDIQNIAEQKVRIEYQKEKILGEINSRDKIIAQIEEIIFSYEEKRQSILVEINNAKSFKTPDKVGHFDTEETIEKLKTQRDEKKKELDKIKELIHQKDSEFFEVERQYRQKRDIESQLNNELTRIEIEMARLKTKKEDLKNELLEYELSEKDLQKINLNKEERENLFREIISLRKKLEFMGGAVSIEDEKEFKEVKKRYDFLETQSEDLKEALKTTKKVVLNLENKIHDQFHQKFSEISQKFNHYFGKLFGGGAAKLTLKEGDEEEDMTIDIQAIPPGKKVHTLATLSGGEKSLTSIALLFAIFSVNPTPFCVLDEVDAALDESNSARFAKLLSDLASKNQFVVVTHNRETMKEAKNLYGVTMDEAKVSKILSLKIEDAQKYSE